MHLIGLIVAGTLITSTWIFIGVVMAKGFSEYMSDKGTPLTDRGFYSIILFGPMFVPLVVSCLILYIIACIVFGKQKVDEFRSYN